MEHVVVVVVVVVVALFFYIHTYGTLVLLLLPSSSSLHPVSIRSIDPSDPIHPPPSSGMFFVLTTFIIKL
jgi:hypothetical protein